MATKILFTDLDGTLLDNQKKISSHTLGMIHSMLDDGHKFILSSGRPLNSVLMVAKEFGFDGPGSYVSSFNGGLIYDCGAGKILLRSAIPMDYAVCLFAEAKKANLHIHTYSATHIVSRKETPELKEYQAHIKMPYIISDDLAATLTEEPMKIIVMDLNGRKRLEQFRAEHADWAKDKVSSTFSSPRLLEYGSLNSTKGNAVRFFCDYFQIPISDAIAVGDEENDTTMIEVAGIGVAMKNATQITKNTADYVTENDNNHDGIAEVIEKFVL